MLAEKQLSPGTNLSVAEHNRFRSLGANCDVLSPACRFLVVHSWCHCPDTFPSSCTSFAPSMFGLEVHLFLLGLALPVSSMRAQPPPRSVRQPSICGLTASLTLLREQTGRCLADPLEEVEVRPWFPNVSAFSRDFLVLTSKRNFWFRSFFPACSRADKGSGNSGCFQ